MLNPIHNNHSHDTDDGRGEKQWVKNGGKYRWAGEACIYVREANNHKIKKTNKQKRETETQ